MFRAAADDDDDYENLLKKTFIKRNEKEKTYYKLHLLQKWCLPHLHTNN